VEGQRMSDAFVEERRAGLQKYLQRLAAHPAIGRSEVRSSWSCICRKIKCMPYIQCLLWIHCCTGKQTLSNINVYHGSMMQYLAGRATTVCMAVCFVYACSM
jgi:hypothetical protein